MVLISNLVLVDRLWQIKPLQQPQEPILQGGVRDLIPGEPLHKNSPSRTSAVSALPGHFMEEPGNIAQLYQPESPGFVHAARSRTNAVGNSDINNRPLNTSRWYPIDDLYVGRLEITRLMNDAVPASTASTRNNNLNRLWPAEETVKMACRGM